MSASYLTSSLPFKIRKVARYVSLYGVSRTLIKVRGQYHMNREASFDGDTWLNPKCRDPESPDRSIGLIGCGNFAYSNIAFYLHKTNRRFLKATYDINPARSRSLCADFGGACAVRNPEAIIDDPQIRLVYIASNHASHADFAIRCLEAGKHVHIEKPHVVTRDQLTRLMRAKKSRPDLQLFLGFNRPRSIHAKKALGALAAQSGTTMVNWFIAGHEIEDGHWYFDEKEGGRVLGNLCHWTDFTLAMIGIDQALPCDVIPIAHPGSKSDFAVGMKFADGSIAGITFSAKGHTFEGVREILHAHKGDLLLTIRDFASTEIEVVEKRTVFKTRHRSHGHRDNIVNSYEAVLGGGGIAVEPRYATATANLFLAVKEAIDKQVTIRVTDEGYGPLEAETPGIGLRA